MKYGAGYGNAMRKMGGKDPMKRSTGNGKGGAKGGAKGGGKKTSKKVGYR